MGISSAQGLFWFSVFGGCSEVVVVNRKKERKGLRLDGGGRRNALKLFVEFVGMITVAVDTFLPSFLSFLHSYDTKEKDQPIPNSVSLASILSYHNSRALLFGWCLIFDNQA